MPYEHKIARRAAFTKRDKAYSKAFKRAVRIRITLGVELEEFNNVAQQRYLRINITTPHRRSHYCCGNARKWSNQVTWQESKSPTLSSELGMMDY